MPDVEHDQSDAESLARKLRRLEPELTVNERRLLDRIMATDVMPGIDFGVAGAAGGAATAPVGSAGSDAAVTGAVEGTDSLRAQFADAFTPGKEWTYGGAGDIGLVH